MTPASQAENAPRRSPLLIALGIVLFGGTALSALIDWFGVGDPGPLADLGNPIYDAVIVTAGIACLVKAHRVEAERAGWLAIAAAVFAWAGAEIYWSLAIENNPAAPYPSLADVGYLVFYPLAAAGLLLLVRARARQLDWRLWVDASIAVLGTAALGTAIVFELVANRATGSTLEVATTLAYPLADIAILALAVGFIALTGWRPGATWTLLLLGLGTMAFADIAYTLQTNGVGILSGDWVEPFYLLAAVFIGAVAWPTDATRIRPESRFDGWRELAVPGLFAIILIGLFGLQLFDQASGLTATLWAATMLAVLARLALSVRENKRLVEAVRTDSLTGLGSQGAMQVDLAEACNRAEVEPLTVALLDLNGFKRYNDTHGHPAGDAMLCGMGAALHAAVADAGRAYRVGGDEFGILIAGGDEQGEVVAKRAAQALASCGHDVGIGAAWGIAAIPDEAATPTDAMQLADVRMYAQKESTRVAQVDGFDIDAADLRNRLPSRRDSKALEQGQ